MKEWTDWPRSCQQDHSKGKDRLASCLRTRADGLGHKPVSESSSWGNWGESTWHMGMGFLQNSVEQSGNESVSVDSLDLRLGMACDPQL